MVGGNIKKGNSGLWVIGQITGLFIGALLTFEYNVAAGAAVCFIICVLVDIRGQM